MTASLFEREHQILVRLALFGMAWLTYLLDREDVVWRFVKDAGNHTRALERAAFVAASALIGLGAYLCTLARHLGPGDESEDWKRKRTTWSLGEFLYAVGLASLVPLAGSVLLIVGEGLRLVRLGQTDTTRVRSITVAPGLHRCSQGAEARSAEPHGWPWRPALRREIGRWGIFVSMIVFCITLRDRDVEVLIGASILLAGAANWAFILSCRQSRAVTIS